MRRKPRSAAIGLTGALATALLLCAAASSAGDAASTDRAGLEIVARSYIAALVKHDGSGLPLAQSVRRTENGLVNANGAEEVRESFHHVDMVEGARSIRIVADPKTGDVVAFYLLDIVLAGKTKDTAQAGKSSYKVAVSVPAGRYTVYEAERFHLSEGKIDQIEIIGHVAHEDHAAAAWPSE